MMICLLLCSAEAKQTLWDSERILSAALYRLEDGFFLSLLSQGFSGVGSTDKESAGPVLPIQTRLPDRGRDSQPRPLSDSTQLDLLKAKAAKPSEPGSDLSQSPKPSEASASKAFSPRPESPKSELPKPAESPKPASSPEKSPNEGAAKGPTPLKGVSQGKDSRLQRVKLSVTITNIALQFSSIRNDQKRSETTRHFYSKFAFGFALKSTGRYAGRELNLEDRDWQSPSSPSKCKCSITAIFCPRHP